MALYQKIAEELKRQIDEGGYAFKDFPSERVLSTQLGVSHVTMRRALRHLVDSRILIRKDTGRFDLNRHPSGRERLSIGLLIPTFVTPVFSRWRIALDRVAEDMDVNIRPILFVHWNDPLLLDALTGFDGLFIIAPSETMPDDISEKMLALPRPPVIVGQDYSARGFPSIVLFPPGWVQHVLDHLAERGHRDIACLSVQPHDGDVVARIGQWQMWMASRKLTGPLFDTPIRSYDLPYDQAYETFNHHWRRHRGEFSAVFCVALADAMGVYRVLYENNLKPGRDLAVATLDGAGMARVLTPSLTAMATPDCDPFLRVCLQWMREHRPWTGPMALRSEMPFLETRESTGSVAVPRHGPADAAVERT